MDNNRSGMDMVVNGLSAIVRMTMKDSGKTEYSEILQEVYILGPRLKENKLAQKLLPTIVHIELCKYKLSETNAQSRDMLA